MKHRSLLAIVRFINRVIKYFFIYLTNRLRRPNPLVSPPKIMAFYLQFIKF